MNNPDNECPACTTEVREADMEKHILECSEYNLTIYKHVRTVTNITPTNVMKFLMAECRIATQHLRDITGKKKSNFKAIVEGNPPNVLIPKKSEEKPKVKEVPIWNQYQDDVTSCCSCRTKIYDMQLVKYIDECWHVICIECIKKHVKQNFVNRGGSLKCLSKGCEMPIHAQIVKESIGADNYQQLMDQMDQIVKKMCNSVTCIKCKEMFEFIVGKAQDAPKKDATGRVVAERYSEDYAQNRFVCSKSSCRTEQCRICRTTPYHFGMTCNQYKENLLAKKCRYCAGVLRGPPVSRHQALSDICSEKECQEVAEWACTKIKACGHPCYGQKNQKNCLPCLHVDCAKQSPQLVANSIDADEYCAVCYTESLSTAPCVRSVCGHVFHLKCLKKSYTTRWLTPRIFFNFCFCPLCKKPIEVPSDSELYPQVKENKELREVIMSMSLKRLKFEELEKNDQKLKDAASPYYQKPQEYAMAIYAYFLCYKCQKPYFGGRKNCAQAMGNPDKVAKFDQKELICANCCEVPIENCPKHDKDFIEFKCKFCCSIAQWFCWGNTHFCEQCHKKQCNGKYVSKYTKEQLPKCGGAGVCPIGGNHNGNGEQKTLGCAICRNLKENKKDY